MRLQLPIVNEDLLDNIGIASPCAASWADMNGDDRVRHCGACRQNVYNLSAMSRAEAAALVAEREGRLCVRLLRRSDGTLITRDCRELLARARRRSVWALGAALVVVGLMQLGLRVFGLYLLVDRWSSSGIDHPPIMMGAVRPVPAVVERETLGEVAPEPEVKPEPTPVRPVMGRLVIPRR